MTSRLLKLVLATTVAALISVSSALANGHHRDNYYATTAYVPSVLAVPSSYVSTSYLVPSSYVDVLYPTIYSSPLVSPTVYVEPTSYVVSGRRSLGRSIYSRTSALYYDLTPTTYSYLPTAYETPLLSPTTLVSEVDQCCLTASASAPIASAPIPSAPSAAARSSAPPSNLQSIPQANPAPANPAPSGNYTDQGPPAAAEDLFNSAPAPAPGPVEPPLNPTPEKENNVVIPPPATPNDVTSPPLGDEYGRTANKPVPTTFSPGSSNLAPGTLRGEVVDQTTRSPLAGVEVVFSDLQRNYADKIVKTDSAGHFEVLLPNADWSISVAESNGEPNTQYDNRITSTGGRFYDAFGRAISSLRLNH